MACFARMTWIAPWLLCGCLVPPRPPAKAATPIRSITVSQGWQVQIENELSALRALAFKAPVPYEEQTREQFRSVVRADLARELPGEKGWALSRTYARMGFL